jgi:hypothetical protein
LQQQRLLQHCQQHQLLLLHSPAYFHCFYCAAAVCLYYRCQPAAAAAAFPPQMMTHHHCHCTRHHPQLLQLHQQPGPALTVQLLLHCCRCLLPAAELTALLHC